MNYSEYVGSVKRAKTPFKRVALAALVLVAATALSACGKQEAKKTGQALASVNGEEITAMQLNEEMVRANIAPAQQEAASKQLLEALIDRQLLLNEAAKDKTDRDPKVVQAIERAKALIVAQAEMQKRLGTIAKPSSAEVEAYFNQHPEFFTKRQQFDMRQLVMATKDVTPEVKAAMDSATSLEGVAAWLTEHKVPFERNQVSRTTADLAPQMSAKLGGLPKGQLFIVREGERSMLITVADTKDVPVTLQVAASQIEQYLMNAKTKEAATASLAQLRASGKIEYLNGTKAPEKAAPGAPATPAAAVAEPAAAESDSAAHARGVAGLK